MGGEWSKKDAQRANTPPGTVLQGRGGRSSTKRPKFVAQSWRQRVSVSENYVKTMPKHGHSSAVSSVESAANVRRCPPPPPPGLHTVRSLQRRHGWRTIDGVQEQSRNTKQRGLRARAARWQTPGRHTPSALLLHSVRTNQPSCPWSPFSPPPHASSPPALKGTADHLTDRLPGHL